MNTKMTPHSEKTYHGVVIPMITPFTAEGALDEMATRRVIDHLVKGGTHGVFVLGTTGEGASVPLKVRKQLISVTVDQVGDRAQVYVGVSDNAMQHTIECAAICAELGVDAVVAHLPSYFPLSAQEQRDYYLDLAENINLPLIIYNIPSTTHMSIPVEVVKELSNHPGIVALKDSENDKVRLENVLQDLASREDFSVLVGVASLSNWALRLGADGIVPSAGNLVPGFCRSLYDLSLQGNAVGSQQRQDEIDAVASIYRGPASLSQSPGRLKTAMGVFELCAPFTLPPLPTPPEAEQEQVRQQFKAWHDAHPMK